MSNDIPEFHRKVLPLNNILENAYKKRKKDEREAHQRIKLREPSRGTARGLPLARVQDSLGSAVKSAFQKEHRMFCVYMDTSEETWSAVTTQTTEKQLTKRNGEQNHEAIAFREEMFNEAQRS